MSEKQEAKLKAAEEGLAAVNEAIDIIEGKEEEIK